MATMATSLKDKGITLITVAIVPQERMATGWQPFDDGNKGDVVCVGWLAILGGV